MLPCFCTPLLPFRIVPTILTNDVTATDHHDELQRPFATGEQTEARVFDSDSVGNTFYRLFFRRDGDRPGISGLPGSVQ